LEAKVPFLKSLRLDGLLSFPPGSEAVPLAPLNVLIGPNGSGKSNLIEGIELLHATPTGFASAIRDGGGVREWLWKGDQSKGTGSIEARIDLEPRSRVTKIFGFAEFPDDLRYRLAFTALAQRVEVTDEVIENANKTDVRAKDVFFYYRFQAGNPVINVTESLGGKRKERHLERQTLLPDESVLSQRKDPVSYPELTELGRQFGRIQTFREWSFGRYGQLRQPQPADLPADILASDSKNLGLILNQLEHSGAWSEFNSYLTRFLPRFLRFSTRIEGGTVQFYLHEHGLGAPIPATRLSDGTIRFMAILAQLLSPTPPPLICMEEPELGLHPDAIALLAGLLQEASTRTQLIVTTHSDALVSALTEVADSVLVCEYRGGTVLKRVESEKLRFWLDKYRLGEIWRIGEIGGNL
jgi:predicted ATPase